MAKDLPAKTWATISPKYEYGYTCWNMFKGTLTKLKPGVSFVADSWAPFGTTDFAPTSIPSWMPNPKDSIPPNGPAS